MSSIKFFVKSDRARRAICWLGANYINLLRITCRWQTLGKKIPRQYWDEGKPFILAFWHGRLLMMPHCWDPGVPIHMLISRHRDGKLIADTVAHFGIKAVSGSSSKGGASALREMVKHLKKGRCIGVTPDGPRGPRMRASEGIIRAARLSGAPIIPATFSVDNGYHLNSWDRFLVAWPFGNGIIQWGDPIEVPRDADKACLEHARFQVETALNAITKNADERVGRASSSPASTKAPT